jgi:hypothetical protein
MEGVAFCLLIGLGVGVRWCGLGATVTSSCPLDEDITNYLNIASRCFTAFGSIQLTFIEPRHRLNYY